MIVLMGLPGSGKGTQGKMLSDEHGFHLFSTGDLSRMYVTGERRRQMMAGALLDDNEVITMLERALQSVDYDNDCVLDGFPRTITQAEWLMDQVGNGRFTVDYVVYLTVSHDAVLSRLQARGRLDDKESVIESRFQEYERLTQPVVDWFESRNVTVLRINGERPASVVNRDIVSQLKLLP